MSLSALDLAGWQFGITTVYHFLFVPLTIGLSVIVAGFQTAWVRTGNERYLRLTKFFGKLFLINFAIGVVTGIVQEFQFGMNWSDYSRFVGDIFGAPLAIEALLAFFLESTFLGLWIFGWDRLPRSRSTWPRSGSSPSAPCSRRTSSWPPTPGCSTRSATRSTRRTGRAELTDFWAVLTNTTAARDLPAHRSPRRFMTGGAFVVGIALWQPAAARRTDDEALFRRPPGPARSSLLVGRPRRRRHRRHARRKIMTERQPMKMAAAEALYDTEQPASFSLFTIGTLDGSQERLLDQDPRPAVLPRHRRLQRQGRGHQRPPGRAYAGRRTARATTRRSSPLTYWTFRLMIGFGLLAAACGGCGSCGALRRGRRARRPGRRRGWRSPLPVPAAARQLASAGSSPRSAASPGSSSA